MRTDPESGSLSNGSCSEGKRARAARGYTPTELNQNSKSNVRKKHFFLDKKIPHNPNLQLEGDVAISAGSLDEFRI